MTSKLTTKIRFKSEALNLVASRLYSISSSESNIIKSSAPFLDFPKGNLVKNIFENVDKFWMRTAIECFETGQKFTYSELVEQIGRWSGFLHESGVTTGDVITMIAPNCLQFAPIFFGTGAVGAALSPINAKYTPAEIQRMLEANKSRMIIYSNRIESTIAAALKGRTKDYQLFSIGKSKEMKCENIDDILYGDRKIRLVDPEELKGHEDMYIPFSSGTTGLPKAVALSHNSLLVNLHQISNSYHDLYKYSKGESQDVQLAMFPFFHIYGSFALLIGGCFNGMKTVIVPQFTAQNFINGNIKHKVSWIHTVPSLLNLLNQTPEIDSQNLPNAHSIICGAAPVLPASVELFRTKIKKEIDFLELYGMTEAMLTHMTPRKFRHSASCGRLLSNVEAKIISLETGGTLGPNQPGEICLRTPATMNGYLNNPAATKELVREGWIHSGDIGYYDDDKFFYIIDRKKDMIKVQGMQISPSEIEDELQKHPSVAECSVIGVPDERSGELPFAFVILKEETSEGELHTFLATRLAKHKQLRGGIKFVDSLPKSETGKVLRRQLRMMTS